MLEVARDSGRFYSQHGATDWRTEPLCRVARAYHESTEQGAGPALCRPGEATGAQARHPRPGDRQHPRRDSPANDTTRPAQAAHRLRHAEREEVGQLSEGSAASFFRRHQNAEPRIEATRMTRVSHVLGISAYPAMDREVRPLQCCSYNGAAG